MGKYCIEELEYFEKRTTSQATEMPIKLNGYLLQSFCIGMYYIVQEYLLLCPSPLQFGMFTMYCTNNNFTF